MLNTRSRLVIAVATLLLVAVYALPLWRISLVAPQYPEGLGMLIWTHTVTGIEPHHLQNINGLNHYIGMKEIDANTIPELRVMPWVLGFLILSGLAVAAAGRRTLVRAWYIVFVVGALAGIADFWKWQYDYGHNLDTENAAIKVPGMTYQPPLIGSKQLLNFTATSWPAAGGLIAFASLAIIGGVLIVDARSRTRSSRTVVVAAVLATAACAPAQPRALVAGEDSCAYCRMVITDLRFGAQAVTSTGKVQTFDSIECLAGYAASLGVDTATVGLYVSDFERPGSFVPADQAVYVAGGSLSSPMGRQLAAFAAGSDAGALRRAYGGDVLDWTEVRRTAADGLGPGHTAHDRGAPDGVVTVQ
jgi:copper chaperone NosL